MTPDTNMHKFFEKVVVEVDSGCWNWAGAQNTYGYSQLCVAGKKVYAHRFAFERLRGPIPDGLQLDHLCRNRGCVNPDHLEPVTIRENVLRGVGRSAQNAVKTHCHKGHEFSEENTYLAHWKGRVMRQCRACRAEWARLKRARDAA